MKQWRVVSRVGTAGSVCFVDAPDEHQARAFFAVAFPRHVIVSVALEPVDVCAQYEPKVAR